MDIIALHCSSFVAKQYGYHADNEWGACVQAVADYYRPIQSFSGRFERLVLHVKRLGFDAMDIWQPGQLNWQWATPQHIAGAQNVLEKHHMTVTSLAGEFGEARDEFLSACRVAKGIGATMLSGMCDLLATDRGFVLDILKQYGLKLALENHTETNARQMLDQIGPNKEDCLGTAVDTGWYATRGVDVVSAIKELDGRIFHVHLKNVLPGEEHINCGYTKGIVSLEACVRTLKKAGFQGVYSVENHVLDHDPDDELREGGLLVRQWLE
jgi:L-ribulose-5-phosphate 3-epimerase